jgi:hypothetical protein
LEYVRSAFDLPIVEPSATKGWENADYKHEDYDFPDAWVPLWFSIDGIPEGHVVLRAPDGRIYSTSTNANSPYVHPNLDHLIWFYGPRVEPEYQLTLRYLGWTEDISNVRVVENEDEVGHVDSISDEAANKIAQALMYKDVPWYGFNGTRPSEGRTSTTLAIQLGWLDTAFAGTQRLVSEVNNAVTATLDALKQLPEVDNDLIDNLKSQLESKLKEATDNLKVTLEVKQ